MSDEILKDIAHRLTVIGRALGLILVTSKEFQDKSTAEKMRMLDSLGLDRNEIANLLDTTPETVTARLWEIQKEKKRQQKKK